MLRREPGRPAGRLPAADRRRPGRRTWGSTGRPPSPGARTACSASAVTAVADSVDAAEEEVRAVVARQLEPAPARGEGSRRWGRAPGRGGPRRSSGDSAVTGALSTVAGTLICDVDRAVDRRPDRGVGVGVVDVPLDAVDLDAPSRRRRSRPAGRRRRPARSAGRPTRRRTGCRTRTRREGSPASSSGQRPISAGQDASASGVTGGTSTGSTGSSAPLRARRGVDPRRAVVRRRPRRARWPGRRPRRPPGPAPRPR